MGTIDIQAQQTKLNMNISQQNIKHNGLQKEKHSFKVKYGNNDT